MKLIIVTHEQLRFGSLEDLSAPSSHTLPRVSQPPRPTTT